jgi:hypothetical protein
MTLKNINQRCKLVNVRHTGQQWGRPSIRSLHESAPARLLRASAELSVRNDTTGKSER